MHRGGIVSVIPWPYRLLALAVLGIALVGFGAGAAWSCQILRVRG